jgi:hypothetical protein
MWKIQEKPNLKEKFTYLDKMEDDIYLLSRGWSALRRSIARKSISSSISSKEFVSSAMASEKPKMRRKNRAK